MHRQRTVVLASVYLRCPRQEQRFEPTGRVNISLLLVLVSDPLPQIACIDRDSVPDIVYLPQ
jgi:hypothetical protein